MPRPIPRYASLTSASMENGEVLMEFSPDRNQMVKLNANPNGPVNQGSLIYLWGKVTVIAMDGFSESDIQFLQELWAKVDVCISMVIGKEFPSWVASTNWDIAHVKGNCFCQKTPS